MTQSQFSVQSRGNYIAGTFSPPPRPDGKFESICPGDESDIIGVVKYSTEDALRAIESASLAFKSWRKTPIEERISKLKAYQDILKTRADELAEILAREVGKPLWEAKTEIQGMIGKITISIAEGLQSISDIEISDILPATNGYCRHKPLGVLAVLGPFNFPGHLPNGHIVPALLSGNTVIFKPSEKTPFVGQLMAECFDAAGIPPGVFSLVQGERAVGELLVRHEKIKGILFTGSYNVGLAIKKATLEQPGKMLALEMGGKNSAIVWKDANLDHALVETLTGAFLTTGQRCSATSKILVHRDIHDEFVDRFQKITADLEIGHPLENPFMGPLIDRPAKENYLAAIEMAKSEGIEILHGGESYSHSLSGHYITPSVGLCNEVSLSHVQSSQYFQKEIFGPNVVVLRIDDLSTATSLANATDYGLVTSVFTQDKQVYEQCWDDLDSGLINWNKSTVGASSKLPFGGIKKSGNFFPTALFAGRYCTVPVTSMEVEQPPAVNPKTPGLHWS